MPADTTKIVKGRNATLQCYGTGAPKPELRWFKGSERIEEDSGHIFLNPSGNLEIKVITF
jgi:hypothetical protein